MSGTYNNNNMFNTIIQPDADFCCETRESPIEFLSQTYSTNVNHNKNNRDAVRVGLRQRIMECISMRSKQRY